MNAKLKKDLKAFLSIYHKFHQVKNNNTPDIVHLSGTIDIVDTSGALWGAYKVAVFFSGSRYPNVIPKVVELSEEIERDWDYHISKEGVCCLAIPHKLILLMNQGIDLIGFYRTVIYPFFANHQLSNCSKNIRKWGICTL